MATQQKCQQPLASISNSPWEMLRRLSKFKWSRWKIGDRRVCSGNKAHPYMRLKFVAPFDWVSQRLFYTIYFIRWECTTNNSILFQHARVDWNWAFAFWGIGTKHDHSSSNGAAIVLLLLLNTHGAHTYRYEFSNKCNILIVSMLSWIFFLRLRRSRCTWTIFHVPLVRGLCGILET